jgi:hypothetical protein
MSYFSGISFRDAPNFDAFNRLRTSAPNPIGDYQFQYDLDPFLVEVVKSGGTNDAAYDAVTRMVELKLTGSVGYAGIQSYVYHPYEAGRSHTIAFTCVPGAPVGAEVFRVGYYDAFNGVFLQQNADGTWQFVLRTSTSGSASDANFKLNSEWSENPGYTLNPLYSIILEMDLQYLGMGRVRCYENRGGVITPLHYFLNEQTASTAGFPYMQSATLPIRAELVSASGVTRSAHVKCATVMSEGGSDELAGYTHGAMGPNASVGSDSTWTHLCSMRPATTHLGKSGGIVNRSMIVPSSVDIMAGTNTIEWVLCVGSVFTGTGGASPTFAIHNKDGGNAWSRSSSVEIGTGGSLPTALVTDPGVVIASGWVPGGSGGQSKGALSKGLTSKWPITLDAAGAQRLNGTYSLFARNVGSSTTARGGFNWREIR